MSAPFWPNSIAGYQNLIWDSNAENLTIAPFGNTVHIAAGEIGSTGPTGANGPTGPSAPGGDIGPNPAFSSITTSSINSIGKSSVTVGAPLYVDGSLTVTSGLTLTGDASITSGQLTFVGGTGNISGVSSINGLSYTYAQPAQTAFVSTFFNIPNQSLNGNPISTLSTFNSETFYFNDFWSYSGPMTFITAWNGSGNTNALQNNAKNDSASAYRQINVSNAILNGGIGQICATVVTGNSLSGSYAPKSTPSTFQQYYLDSVYPMTVQLNGSGGGYYTGGGAEANITVYGSGSVIIQDHIDFYLDSGDPGANYGFTYAAPMNAAGNGTVPAVVTWR